MQLSSCSITCICHCGRVLRLSAQPSRKISAARLPDCSAFVDDECKRDTSTSDADGTIKTLRLPSFGLFFYLKPHGYLICILDLCCFLSGFDLFYFFFPPDLISFVQKIYNE